MSLSSLIFLFVFLPLTLAGYYLIRPNFRNVFLVAASLVFYAWGSIRFMGLLVISIAVNYALGLLLEKWHGKKSASKSAVLLMLFWNFGLLFYFKYLVFTLESINQFTGAGISIPQIALPLGISFFTFKAVSYCLDIHWGSVPAQKNPINMALYISFFPQITMGPIDVYHHFNPQLAERRVTLELISEGARRFILGMAKKLVIANSIAVMVDKALSIPPEQRSVVLAWMGILGFGIQLYFDFAGYSDMAIGLGKMFGFETPENFDYPYLSKSVVEYWSRWHITLGIWLKNYLYTPAFRGLLSKKNPITKKNFSIHQCDIVALFATWMFAGIWHGATWSFVFYGFYYFAFIALERTVEYFQKKRRKKLKLKKKPETRLHAALSHVYLLIAVTGGMLVFWITDFTALGAYLRSMFGIHSPGFIDSSTLFLLKDNAMLFLLGILFSMPVIPKLRQWIKKYAVADNVFKVVVPVGYCALFVVSISFLVSGSYNPFIYQNF